MSMNQMPRRVLASLSALALWACATPSFADAKPGNVPTTAVGTIQYVANMGLLVSDSEKSVLIDALFRRGEPAYDGVDDATRELMEVAKPPFDKVKIALATHFHKDHFDPKAVSRFMRNNASARFVSTVASVGKLVSGAVEFDSYRDRVRSIEPDEGSSIEFAHGGVSVDVLRLSHGGALFTDVVNIGFIVHIGGKRILHVGDGVLDPTTVSAVEAAAVDVDVLCVPYGWLLDYDGQTLIKQKIKPKKIIALHFATGEAESRGERVHRYFPNATIMSRPGQTTPF